MTRLRFLCLPLLMLAACAERAPAFAQSRPFAVQELATFDEPWAMAFLPGGDLLVTEKAGRLRLRSREGGIVEVTGVPAVDYGGQGGLGDVVLHPDFARNGTIYLSFAEAGEGGRRGPAVGRGQLVVTVTFDRRPDGRSAPRVTGARLVGFEVIWRQVPKFSGRGHYGHRLAFSPDGRHLFISSGERQEFTPAQDMASNAGKIVRLKPTAASRPTIPLRRAAA